MRALVEVSWLGKRESTRSIRNLSAASGRGQSGGNLRCEKAVNSACLLFSLKKGEQFRRYINLPRKNLPRVSRTTSDISGFWPLTFPCSHPYLFPRKYKRLIHICVVFFADLKKRALTNSLPCQKVVTERSPIRVKLPRAQALLKYHNYMMCNWMKNVDCDLSVHKSAISTMLTIVCACPLH